MVKYVPIDLVRRLYESGRDPVLGAEALDVSLMFTDIADFTTHAESLSPAQLPNPIGARLLETARAAFTHAMQFTVILCAVIAVLTAVAAVLMLRRIRARAESEPSDDITANALETAVTAGE